MVKKGLVRTVCSGSTAAYIRHQCVFLTVYICNSDFHHKNPRSKHLKICFLDFLSKTRGCSISKLATRYVKNPSCKSHFYLKLTSELQLSQKKQRGFFKQKLKLCYFKTYNLSFYYRHLVSFGTIRSSLSTRRVLKKIPLVAQHQKSGDS